MTDWKCGKYKNIIEKIDARDGACFWELLEDANNPRFYRKPLNWNN